MKILQEFRIEGVTKILGGLKRSVDDLFPGALGLVEKTGIPNVWESESSAYEMGVEAARQLLSQDRSSENSIGILIYVSQSPSWHLPAHACRMQADLGLHQSMLAFDVNQGCSGFVQALHLATSLMTDEFDALIVTSDTYRSKLDPLDRSTNAIFSDGASAVLFTKSRPSHEVLAVSNLTDGTGADLLTQKVLGGSGDRLFMSGKDVYLFTRRVVISEMLKAARSAEIDMCDIDRALVHQASKLVIDGIRRDLAEFHIDVPSNLEKYGNTVSSTIPLLLSDDIRQRLSGTTLMSGFGVGLSCSTILIREKPTADAERF
jgi:3-oxoacyl-[acyl-carrier-protein] synthase-3